MVKLVLINVLPLFLPLLLFLIAENCDASLGRRGAGIGGLFRSTTSRRTSKSSWSAFAKSDSFVSLCVVHNSNCSTFPSLYPTTTPPCTDPGPCAAERERHQCRLITVPVFISITLQTDFVGQINTYPVETHTVKTPDKYLLRIHRLPQDKPTNKVILIMHGMFCSSIDWVLIGPGKSIGGWMEIPLKCSEINIKDLPYLLDHPFSPPPA